MKKTTVGLLVFSIAVIFPASIFGADSGADLFKTRCAVCHGQMGNARTPVAEKQNLRDLASAEVQKLTDAELTAIIAEGGAAKRAAHAFKNKGLDETAVRSVVVYLRTLPTLRQQ